MDKFHVCIIYHLNECFIAEAPFNKLVLCDAAIIVGVQGVKDLSEKGESETHLHIDAQTPAPFDQVIKKIKDLLLLTGSNFLQSRPGCWTSAATFFRVTTWLQKV